MSRTTTTSLLLLLLIVTIATDAQIQRPIGTNTSQLNDWSTEIVFVDVFKQCRSWISFEKGGGWSSGIAVALGENGYPLEIPYNNGIDPPQYVRTLLLWDLNRHFPSGEYRLIVSGTGQISLSGAATGTYSCPADTLVSVDNKKGGIILEFNASLKSDPINAIRFILPGRGGTYLTHPFNPAFLSFLSDFQAIRYMNMMKINNSSVTLWSDRTPKSNYTQTLSSGVAIEYLIELSNTARKDVWISIPHLADDQYVINLATLLRDSLDERLKVYVEYSNEVWNGTYNQNQYAKTMGASLGYSGEPWEKGWKYYAKRSADIHRIFEDVFGDNARLINVIAGQAANSWLCNYIVDRYEEAKYNPTQVQAGVLAIAPYFGNGLADAIGNAGLIGTITVDKILDSLEQTYLPKSFDWMDALKVVADKHNIGLVAYEGGQHLVTYAYNNNAAFVDTLIAVNRHQRMENLYCNYFDYWYSTVQGGLFCNYSSHGLPSKYGSWGVKEFLADTLAAKYAGLKNCV